MQASRFWCFSGVVLLGSWLIPAFAWAAENTITTGDVVFYTFAVSGVGFFILTVIALKELEWLVYGAYGALLLTLFAALDHTLGHVLGLGQAFNAVAPLIIGSLICTFGFWLAAYRIEPPHPLRRLVAPLHIFAALSLAMIPMPWLFDSLVPPYAIINTLVMIVVTVQIIPPMTWARQSTWQHGVAKYFPMLFAAAVLGVYGAHFLGPGYPQETLNMANRVFFVIHIGHIFGLVVANIIDSNRAHILTAQRAAKAAQTAAEQALALNESRQAYQEVQRVAHARSLKLAEASHDMKQPIAALRAAVRTMQETDNSREAQRIEQAMEYLDLLATNYLQSSASELEGGEDFDAESARQADGQETVQVGLLLASLAQMFAADAEAAGVRLSVRDSRLAVTTKPLLVLRILSNLVNNALEHAQASRLLVGVRRRQGEIALVVADDGVGMDAAALDAATNVLHKGSESEGTGLGLAIVSALADEGGLRFTIRSRPGKGTIAELGIPFG